MKVKNNYMGKQLKDYLHLYLGCKLLDLRTEKQGFLIGILNQRVLPVLISIGDEVDHVYFDQVKPILRPLSNIEAEEMQTLFQLNDYNFSSFENFKGLKVDMENNCIEGYGVRENGSENYVSIYFHLLNPDQFRFLIHFTFDLFGLIDAGLAIDATTIKAPTCQPNF
jgi:hypothetical protein